MNIDVFISYHTETSKNIADAIVNKLESLGMKCWYAPRDTEGDYAGSISRAINACKVFLLILNKKSSESPHVLNELNKVTKRLGKQEEVNIIPFHVADEEISEDADYYIGRMHWIDAMTPPMEQRIAELADKVSVVLDKKQAVNTISQDDNYRLEKMSIYADKRFKGREDELRKIHEILTSDKNKLFLVGMGGSGKSELARKYCEEYAKDWNNIIWISFNQSLKETFINDNTLNILGLSRNEHLDKSADEYFAYKLRVLKDISDEKTLLVVDNFDVTGDEHLKHLCAGKYAVLYTTRYRDISEKFEQMFIDEIKLGKDKQLELFNEVYKRKSDENEIGFINEILELLDGHILSIRLVASAMNSNRIKPEKMVEILKSSGGKTNSFYRIHDRLKEMMRLSNLSEEEMYLMKNLSLVSLQGIDTERFVEWCEADGFDVVDGLVTKSWIIRDDETDIIHLHPIVSDLAFEELAADFGACDAFLKHLKEKCGKSIFAEKYQNKQWLYQSVNYVCDKLSSQPKLNYQILLAKAHMLKHLSLYEDSIKLHESILKNENLDMEDRRLIYEKLAHMYCLNGMPEEAIILADKCIQEYFPQKVKDMNSDELYMYKELLTRIAEGNRTIGNYDRAEEYAEKGLKISSSYFKTGVYSSVAWGKYHLARILYMRGSDSDIIESETLIDEAIQQCIDENNIWAKDFCEELSAQIKMKQGKFDDAIKMTEKAFKSKILFLSKYHVDTAINRVFMGNIYRTMGNEGEAVKCYNLAIEIFNKCGIFKLAKNAENILKSGKIGYVS